MYTVVASVVCKIFLIIAVGFIAARKKLIDETVSRHLSSILMEIVLPFSILSSSQQVFSTDRLREMGVSLLLSAGYYILSILFCLFLADRLGFSDSRKRIFVTLTVFANVGFMGFSIMQEILGDTGTLYTVVHNSAYQIFFFSYGLYLLKGEGKLTLRSLFGSRIIWISISSVILYLLPFRFPAALTETCSTVGSMLMPLSMLIIGAQIGRMELRRLFGEKQALLVDVLRMFVFPAIMFAVLKLLQIEHETAVTAFVLSALPSGSLNVVMAEEYRREPEFATIAVAQNMLLMILTIPLVIFLTGYL